MLRAGFFAWMLLCFDASKLRCLDAPLERARERKKERENKQGPGFQGPGFQDREQAGREQGTGRQRTGRQRTGNYEVQVLGQSNQGIPEPLYPSDSPEQTSCKLLVLSHAVGT